jgi:hypothetical protein
MRQGPFLSFPLGGEMAPQRTVLHKKEKTKRFFCLVKCFCVCVCVCVCVVRGEIGISIDESLQKESTKKKDRVRGETQRNTKMWRWVYPRKKRRGVLDITRVQVPFPRKPKREECVDFFFVCSGRRCGVFFLTYASQPEKASQCNERRCLGADHVAETALFVSPLCICCFPAKNLHVREQQYVQH